MKIGDKIYYQRFELVYLGVNPEPPRQEHRHVIQCFGNPQKIVLTASELNTLINNQVI